MKNDKNWHFFLIIVAVLFVWINAPLIDEDEGFMAEISREMIVNQDYISPKMNDELRFDKPPFFNWLQVISFYLFGITTFSARLPAVIGAIIWFYYFRKTLQSLKLTTTPNTIIFFFASPQILILALAGIQESFNNACFLALVFYVFYDDSFKGNLRIIIIATFISISILSKGPLVILLILSIIIIDFLIDSISKLSFNFNQVFKKYRFKFSDIIQIFVLICFFSLPWYIKMYQIHGNFFIQSFFFDHHFNRFLKPRESHNGRIWFYPLVFIISNITLIPFIINGLKFNFKNSNFRILYVLIFFVFVFFTFAETKLHHYVVIAYPAFLILATTQLNDKNSRIASIFFLIFDSILISILVFLYLNDSTINDQYISEVIKDSKLEIVQFLLILIMLFLINLFSKTSIQTLTVSCMFLSLSIFYFVSICMQKTILEIAELIVQKNLKIKNLDHYNPSLSFYSKRIIQISEVQINEIVCAKINQIDVEKYKILYKNKGIVLAKRIY